MVYYSTAMVDLSVLAQNLAPSEENYLWFYDDPIDGSSSVSGTTLDKSSQPNPLQVWLFVSAVQLLLQKLSAT